MGVKCTCNWQYNYIMQGNGVASAHIDPAHGLALSTPITVTSTDFNTQVPTAVKVGTPAVTTNGQPGVHFSGKMAFKTTNAGGHVVTAWKDHVQTEVEKQLNTLGAPTRAKAAPRPRFYSTDPARGGSCLTRRMCPARSPTRCLLPQRRASSRPWSTAPSSPCSRR